MIAGWLKYAAMALAAFALVLVVNGIYRAGYATAEAKGNAALAALEKTHAEENVALWAQYAAREREARVRLQEEQARADSLTDQLQRTETALATERRDFTRRIANATRGNNSALSAEYVGLYNEALYGPAGAGRTDKAGSASSAAHSAGTTAPVGSGVLPHEPVTLADLLAHARDYGGWCRTLEAREHTWAELSAGW